MTEEGLVLLTSEAEGGKLVEVQECLLARREAGGHGAPSQVMSMRSAGPCAPLVGRSGAKLSLRTRGSRAINLN